MRNDQAIPLEAGLEMKCRRCTRWHVLFEPPSESTAGPNAPMLYYHCPPGSGISYYAGSVGEQSDRAVRRPLKPI